MIETWVRIYIVVGLAVFGFRGFLYEVGIPGWLLLLSLALAGGLLLIVGYLANRGHLYPVGLVSRGHDILARHHLVSR